MLVIRRTNFSVGCRSSGRLGLPVPLAAFRNLAKNLHVQLLAKTTAGRSVSSRTMLCCQLQFGYSRYSCTVSKLIVVSAVSAHSSAAELSWHVGSR